MTPVYSLEDVNSLSIFFNIHILWMSQMYVFLMLNVMVEFKE